MMKTMFDQMGRALDDHARAAGRVFRLWFGLSGASGCASKPTSRSRGARPAAGHGKSKQENETMAKKNTEVSSKRAAGIAARVLKGGRYNEADVKALAGSVLTQAPTRPKQHPSAKRPKS